jgi:hypothetical protein
MPSIIPAPLTALSTLRQGISETRCLLRVLEAYNKLGIPTGDLPNGNVNPVLLLEKERIKAIFDEFRENVKIEVNTGPLGTLVATPAGPGTIPPFTTFEGILI